MVDRRRIDAAEVRYRGEPVGMSLGENGGWVGNFIIRRCSFGV
jgi:hypothetical protein